MIKYFNALADWIKILKPTHFNFVLKNRLKLNFNLKREEMKIHGEFLLNFTKISIK